MTDTTTTGTNDVPPKPSPPANGEHDQRQGDPTRLPDDHPLVTAFARQKAENEALKEKARRLDELEEAKKTDAEKVADRLAQAERAVEQVPAKVAEQLRAHLVRMHSISDDDRDLFLTSSDPETLVKQVERLVGRSQKSAFIVPTQGTADPASVQVSSYELGSERARARYQKQN